MTSEEISKIGVVKTENEAKVKIPVSEYRDLIEAVEKLRHVAEEEHTNYMNLWSKSNKLEEEVELLREFVDSAYELRERFYEFKQDKKRSEAKEA